MLGDTACGVSGVGSIWGRSETKVLLDKLKAEQRAEQVLLDKLRDEHKKLEGLYRALDEDLADVEGALEKLTIRMNWVEPQEQEDFNKIRFLESRIIKLEAQMKSVLMRRSDADESESE